MTPEQEALELAAVAVYLQITEQWAATCEAQLVDGTALILKVESRVAGLREPVAVRCRDMLRYRLGNSTAGVTLIEVVPDGQDLFTLVLSWSPTLGSALP